ncbi:sulfurtransferase [Mycolicibacterium sp. 018/SC-01/001]|uniref:sulfurtransferase n=1 Tax=Mycolicibacterium sp. 018/SC-01/001 TaxID=2592069 RepID=UPI00117E30CA|nr:sulfurtransferase [Mycolicibacterium sp. 018/SC-01/001]TRW86141.1 sulfurtransferase [Mycolicibacterium sp. 018/SC-01/001]
MSEVFISAYELAGMLERAEPVTLLDVRWSLPEPDGTEAYRRGHLPGAVYVSLDDELTDHSVTGRGRHPLPSGAAVQAAARRWGVRTGVPVVVYDDWNRAGSARAWWVLTAAGIPDVRILDGGLADWHGELRSGTEVAEPGDVTVTHGDLYAGALPTVTADEAVSASVLIDARAPERFRGEHEPVDPVAGHIPGARNVPSTSLLAEDGTLRDDLTARFGALDARPAVYCGSGVTASVVVAALASIGMDAALFPGSWSQYSAESARPVTLGE